MIELLNNKIVYKLNNNEVGYILFCKNNYYEYSIFKVFVKE